MRVMCAVVSRFNQFSMLIGKSSPIFCFPVFLQQCRVGSRLGRASFLIATCGERKSKEGGEIGSESGKRTYFFFAWASALVPRSFAARPSHVLSNCDLLDSKKNKNKNKRLLAVWCRAADYKFTFNNKFLAVKQQRHP